MAGYKIPTLLNNFNTYASGHKYVGRSEERRVGKECM